ncbi:TipJ family phage tail tip protein, partial [Xanthomonas maliensis]|uniref:TipJ family phage tail tip protein n=1 Tax=Xanthomonas maliensis TaxID=1321368 RepID=UPI003CCDF33A
MALFLTPGINVASVEALYLGDALLSSYEGVTTWFSGFSGMPEQTIPLYSNVDTVDGGELANTTAWVTRTTSADTVRIQVNLEYILGGVGTSGKPYQVGETVEVQYCPTGTSQWTSLITRTFQSKDLATTRRATLARDVARGQYDVRARILG